MKLKIIAGIGLLLVILIVSCQSEEQLEFDRYYSAGSIVYQSRCQNCHGAKGEGLQALMPPLTDSAFLKANRALLSCSVKYGLNGKVSISKKIFEGQMPPNDLAPIEIANVLTYVTNSFGNKMGTITSQQVEIDLRKCR
ncbi:MAG TPA: copper oxidase [Mucilaginibacter sp.]|jgi:mono/diheme cytochrome c family protein|nr:copper oxidase [Mucilaginibacter sp.]